MWNKFFIFIFLLKIVFMYISNTIPKVPYALHPAPCSQPMIDHKQESPMKTGTLPNSGQREK